MPLSFEATAIFISAFAIFGFIIITDIFLQLSLRWLAFIIYYHYISIRHISPKLAFHFRAPPPFSADYYC
jgi:hypothetical protein